MKFATIITMNGGEPEQEKEKKKQRNRGKDENQHSSLLTLGNGINGGFLNISLASEWNQWRV